MNDYIEIIVLDVLGTESIIPFFDNEKTEDILKVLKENSLIPVSMKLPNGFTVQL